jgi:adenine-specific DNA-methyltransferase
MNAQNWTSEVDIVAECFAAGQRVLTRRSSAARKLHGQYFTSPTVARYMAEQLGTLPDNFTILDPAVGSGVLLCAVIERLINEGSRAHVHIEAYEIDPMLYEVAASTLEHARVGAAKRGLTLDVRVHCGDYILQSVTQKQPTLFSMIEEAPPQFDCIIANPPYFKLNADDPRVQASRALVGSHTNIYTLFMALAVDSLTPQGTGVFIVPRSFCSGAYFARFREEFADRVTIERLHLFESRGDNFDEVLQENVIVTFRKREHQAVPAEMIAVSVSHNGSDIAAAEARAVPASVVMHRRDRALFYRLPTTPDDELILRAFDAWSGSLHRYGMDVSTGRVVAFRAEAHLQSFSNEDSVPLLWMQHVKAGHVEYPLRDLRKPQWMSSHADAVPLLVPSANYVLLRRFSAKEEPRRLVAGAFLGSQFGYSTVGFENHLNYVYRKQGALTEAETYGLAALYNSALFDRYFRITNGNTQVNAAELRALPLPPLSVIQQIGAAVIADPGIDVDRLVPDTLLAANLLPAELLSSEKM